MKKTLKIMRITTHVTGDSNEDIINSLENNSIKLFKWLWTTK